MTDLKGKDIRLAPLMGLPGVVLSGSTVRQNLEDPQAQWRSLSLLFERFSTIVEDRRTVPDELLLLVIAGDRDRIVRRSVAEMKIPLITGPISGLWFSMLRY